MGDGLAVESFVHTFDPVVSECQSMQRDLGPYVDQLVVQTPLEGKDVDLSFTKYADDVTTKLVGGVSTSAAALADASRRSNDDLDGLSCSCGVPSESNEARCFIEFLLAGSWFRFPCYTWWAGCFSWKSFAGSGEFGGFDGIFCASLLTGAACSTGCYQSWMALARLLWHLAGVPHCFRRCTLLCKVYNIAFAGLEAYLLSNEAHEDGRSVRKQRHVRRGL